MTRVENMSAVEIKDSNDIGIGWWCQGIEWNRIRV